MTTSEITLAAYNRRIVKVSDITRNDHIVYKTKPDPDQAVDRASFKRCITGYLSRAGHPTRLIGALVTPEEGNKHHDNPVLRANLLLQSITDDVLMPANHKWVITVCICQQRSATSPLTYFLLVFNRLQQCSCAWICPTHRPTLPAPYPYLCTPRRCLSHPGVERDDREGCKERC